MIYAFAGEDTYTSLAKAKAGSQKLAEKAQAEVNVLNADEIYDINTFVQELEGVGMFVSSKVILAKRLFNNKKLLEYFSENYEKLKAYDIIIWHDSKIDSKLKLAKKLLADKALFTFEAPKEGEMKHWIINEAKLQNLDLTPAQVNFMYERLENKLQVKNELTKIQIFCDANNKSKLSDLELESIMGFDIKGDLWKFLDFVGNKSKKNAFREFIKLTTYENNAQLLIAMLNRELRLLYSYKYAKQNGSDLRELKMAPFILRKTAEKSGKYSLKEIEDMFTKLFETDLSIKSGLLDEHTALTLFLSSI